jgi:hypothetical protein
MSGKEREPGYNNQMKIECGEELKRILLEQGIKQVIDQGFEVHESNGSMIAKFNNEDKFLVVIESSKTTTSFCEDYNNSEQAIKEFLKPNE